MSGLEELKRILACPQCRDGNALVWHEAQGQIHCGTCLLAYPLEEGVPVMLVSEAKPLPRAPAKAQ